MTNDAWLSIDEDTIVSANACEQTTQVRRYCTWDDERQFIFRNVLLLLRDEAQRQYDVYSLCVLQGYDTQVVAYRFGVTPDSIRMAKMRAQGFVRRVAGEWVERDALSPPRKRGRGVKAS